MWPGFPGATFSVLRRKFDKVQAYIAMSNQHICKEATPTASIKKNRYFPISIERLPLSACTFFFFLHYSERLTFLTGCTDINPRISVSSLPDFPESPFLSRLLPEPLSSSLPVLHLPGRPALFQMHRSHCRGRRLPAGWLTHGPKARQMHQAPALNEPKSHTPGKVRHNQPYHDKKKSDFSQH